MRSFVFGGAGPSGTEFFGQTAMIFATREDVHLASEMPRESLSHLFLWREWKYFFDKLNDSADTRGYLVAGLLCKKYGDLKPVSITFLRVEERDFTAEDYRQGYRPFDSRFINVRTVAKFDC